MTYVLAVNRAQAQFAECGISIEADITDVVDYREGSEDISIRKLPKTRKHASIALKRGYTSNGDLWKWYRDARQRRAKRHTATITRLDERGAAVEVWRVTKALPVKWTGPAMNAKAARLPIDELTLECEALLRDATVPTRPRT